MATQYGVREGSHLLRHEFVMVTDVVAAELKAAKAAEASPALKTVVR